jgi:microcystin-dependent protein
MEAIGGTLNTYVDPSSTGYFIQSGNTFGTNRIVGFYGQNSGSLAGTAQFFSTMTVCANPATSGNEACIQTYPPTAPNPVGTVISKAVSTLSIQVSSINGLQIPQSLGVPIGSVTIWAGGSDNGFSTQNFNIPPGWLLCDGSFFLNSIFPALASVLGNKYGYPGLGPPAGQTALPDLTFAVPMGTPYRNYTLANIPSIPNINLQAQTSDSAYNTTSLTGGGTQVSSVTTWYITSKIGPVLNYGTVFPGNSITVVGTSVTFPSVYVSSIIAYEGAANDTGFIVLRSVDGTSPIPRVPATSTIAAVGQGVAGTLPGGADTPYFLGSANVEGKSQVTRNQKGIEVGQHNHKGTADFNILGSVALPNTACGTGGFTQPNYQPYVSTPTYLSRNVGTYTAPNFLNMTYIIRGL